MRRTFAMVAALSLLGCSDRQPGGTSSKIIAADMMEAPANERTPAATGPQIAYTYSVGYRLGDGAIRTVQAGHVSHCATLGQSRCRVVSTNLSTSNDANGYAGGQAVFLVDARLAKGFIAKLDAAAEAAGGTPSDRAIEAEDVTKQLIDTEARVRAKQALADRLLALIKSTNAKVADLVEAEKAFADTQEALDAARSLQAELRQRVAMSRITVEYSSAAAMGAWGPVMQSLRSVGATLATSIAALVTFTVAAAPWALLIGLLAWIGRRRGWRLPWWPRRPDRPIG